ncbi:MAG TPA: response regulator [Burkholderiales bacterium]|nr:response regulator [Burkholderiales bacterium]
MDQQVFALTQKGSAELLAADTSLSAAELRLLVLIDGRSSVAQIIPAASSLTRETVVAALQKLAASGYIASAADITIDAIDSGDFFTKALVAPTAGGAFPQAASESDAGVSSLKENGYYVRIARRAATPRALAAGEKIHVVVVEDDAQVGKLLRMMLSMEGLVPRLASTRDEILAALRQTPKPDLVLLDVMLPDIDGFEVLARIRQHDAFKSVLVIMLTARTTREAVLEGLMLGADGYITKPFDLEVLLKAVKTVLGLPK